MACGSSQARGQIGAASATYTAAHGSARCFNPLSGARDRTQSSWMPVRFVTSMGTMGPACFRHRVGRFR